MPRGKNYVNQNKGMTLATHKKGERVKEACMYGAACTRKDCIYDHSGQQPEFLKSNDPCMAFLAGQCLFTAQTCRKRHCLPDEAEKIRAKYANTKCRFGNECRTSGCLYNHDDTPYKASLTVKTAPLINLNKGKAPPALDEAAFPPLSGSKPIDRESAEVKEPQPQQQYQYYQQQSQAQHPQYTAAPMTPQQRHYMAMMMMQQRQQQQRQQQQQSHGGWIPTPPGNMALQAGAPAQQQQPTNSSSTTSLPPTMTTTTPMIPRGTPSSLKAHAPSYNPYSNANNNSN